MKRILFGFFLTLFLCSHDMYLKFNQYWIKPGTEGIIQLVNGTCDRSENVITRDRMLDVSLLSNNKRINVDTTSWYEKDSTTYLRINTDTPGTWVAGVSTRARTFGQSAEDFNDYLKHDGVLDMLELRRENGTLQDSAVEKYSKHVKTIFQVGDRLTDDYKTELGYPIEFILLRNPYDLHPGHDLPVKLLFEQKPLANQLVYVGHQAASHENTHDGHTHSHVLETDHQHDEMLQLRTDPQGIVSVPITDKGIWYLRTIHLVEVNTERLTHESNWATVTFGIGSGHAHDHDEDSHSHEEGISGYLYGLLSLLVIVGLYFWFNRK